MLKRSDAETYIPLLNYTFRETHTPMKCYWTVAKKEPSVKWNGQRGIPG